MNPLKNATILPLLIALTLGCFELSPTALAVDPPPDGGYPNQNSAGGDDALFSLTTGADNALAGWIWEATGSLNRQRLNHTATLLQNGRVLVTGGSNDFGGLPSAELYNPPSGTWTATGSLNTAHAAHTATLLPNPIMVLIAGGFADGRPLSRAELGRGRR